MSLPISFFETAASSYLQLETVADRLNSVTDELGKTVSIIDDGLKKLNLGVTTWVIVSSDETESDENSFYSAEELGYAKINGKWGIALRTREGNIDVAFSEDEESWHFNEAPRALRLKAIEKIPALLRKLEEEATKVTNELQARLAEAKMLAAAISGKKPTVTVAKTDSEPRIFVEAPKGRGVGTTAMPMQREVTSKSRQASSPSWEALIGSSREDQK